ncbi:unnamed protein product, partial [Rotaria magnacalcarata]
TDRDSSDPRLGFILLSINDLEFSYLKWLLNNVKKLEVLLHSGSVWRTTQMIWKSFINANVIRQYYLPDQIINLNDFRFYIRADNELS